VLRQLRTALRTGIVTEPVAPGGELERIGARLTSEIARLFGRSLAIRQVDAGSCNGCELEITGLTAPQYDLERFGIHFVAAPPELARARLRVLKNIIPDFPLCNKSFNLSYSGNDL
jgi:hypothetical protein